MGVVFETNTNVIDFDLSDNRISKIITNKGEINLKNDSVVVVCAGSWCP